MLSLPQLLGLGTLGAGGLLTGKAYQRLGDIGEQARRESSELAETGMEQSQFRPFTVTTGTGGALSTTPEGGLTVGLSPQEQAFQQQMFGGAGQFYGQAMQPTQEREQAVFERIRQAQRPEEERQRLATEERLASQGRLGLRTAQFGGAPEQFALAKAQEESRNQAMLSAMQQAQQEQMQQAQLGGQFMGAGYTPQAQALNVLQAGLPAAQMAQRGQLYGAGLFGEAEMGGLEALLGSGLGQANLYGQLGTGLLSGLLTPQSVGMGGGVTEIVNPFFELLGIGG
jgi:hypothetical protein